MFHVCVSTAMRSPSPWLFLGPKWSVSVADATLTGGVCLCYLYTVRDGLCQWQRLQALGSIGMHAYMRESANDVTGIRSRRFESC